MFLIISILEILFISYFGYLVVYNLTLSVSGHFYRSKLKGSSQPSKFHKILVLIPAYKEDSVILEVAKKALDQIYPSQHYEVAVIADQLKPETVKRLKELPILTEEVHFEKSTKVRSLKSVLNKYNEYDIAVVLDADNIMDKDFLTLINAGFNLDMKVIQGRRVAKNDNNSVAILDGLSEIINNFIFRQGSAALGLSSPVIGSGMAFEYRLLRDKLNNIDSIGGFDKELQASIISDGFKIEYCNEAIVYDEKVDDPQVFENQRKRWVSSQYIYFKRHFISSLKSVFKGNLSLFNISVLMHAQLPRLISLVCLLGLTVTYLFIEDYLFLSYYHWLSAFLIYITSIFLAIPARFYTKDFFIALLKVPQLFKKMVMIHFKLKGANKSFIHTPHKH
ncbi:glycosyltransferase family 2 protein [Fulvivirga sp. M361]|uniref:glycosyltransferase n=1 Tax=Fulvivirga sp. M361 TaxID=2594266 RepID=UPI00162873C2|nr:glycosyltransferase [Fulvivirga sp. M361]